MAEKEIRFVDADYNTIFKIPDGGRIVVTRPKDEIYQGVQEQWIGECQYIDETHVEINGRCWHIVQFAKRQAEIGSTVTPEIESEMIGGYRVTGRIFVRDLIFKIGHNPNAVEPYATWCCNAEDPANNYWGHYTSTKNTAQTDFFLRADYARRDMPYDHTVLKLMDKPTKSSLKDEIDAYKASNSTRHSQNFNPIEQEAR